jgi:uncharacterized protein (DUF608 family)
MISHRDWFIKTDVLMKISENLHKLKGALKMKSFMVFVLFSSIFTLLCCPAAGAVEWELSVKYDMSYPNLKAYRYGPMLGGIGTGGLSFNTAGLCNYTLFSYAFNEGNLDGSFFAAYVDDGEKKAVRFLQSFGRGAKGFAVEKDKAFEHGVGAEAPGAGRRRRVETGEWIGADFGQKMVDTTLCYSLPPAVETHYLDADFPCRISATAFSPLIPHDYRSSNLPAVVFVYHLENPTDRSIEVSLLFSFQNNIGWVDKKKFENTFNKIIKKDGLTTIVLDREPAGIKPEHSGQVVIAVPDSAGKVSYIAEWDAGGDGADLFKGFQDDGSLSNSAESIGTEKQKAGAVAVKVTLAAGEKKDVPFFLAWYFEKMDLRDADVTSFGTVKEGKEIHYELSGWTQHYTKYISGAAELVKEAAQNYLKWWDKIYALHNSMVQSAIPDWLVSRYFHDLTYIPKWTYWIERDGEEKFLVQEGQFGDGLCTVDVDGYNWLVLWWARLELAEMRQLAEAQWADGESVQELAMYGGSHGHLEAMWFTIRTWQDYAWTLDDEFLRFMWPSVKKTIDYTLRKEFDAETGLAKVEYSGCNSYDSWRMDGAPSYGNSQWLVVLRMAEKMAQIAGETEPAEKYRKLFAKAQSSMIEQLWTEAGPYSYFRLCTGNVWDKDACHVEQLIGTYWGDHLGLEVLPDSYNKLALETIYTLNNMGQLGWVCGRFPDGSVPLWDRALKAPASKMQHSGRNRGVAQWNLATLLLTQGRIDEGVEAGELIYNMESTRKQVSLWNYPYYLCYFWEDGSFGGYFPAIYTSYPRMGSLGYYIGCAGAVATEKGLYIKPRVRFSSSDQKYFVHWANADVEISASGLGDSITSAKVNGRDWTDIHPEKGVLLPPSLGKKGDKIIVEVRYD